MHKFIKRILPISTPLKLAFLTFFAMASLVPLSAAAQDTSPTGVSHILVPTSIAATKPCGAGLPPPHGTAYVPSIDIGCQNKGNPIADALFAIIRVLSDGVGLVVIGSIIVGGIQYSASRGDPQATAQAVNRIRSTLIALLIYIFGYAVLNYLIPGAFLNR